MYHFYKTQVLPRNDSFHLQKREIATTNGEFRVSYNFVNGPRYFIPLSPRVIFATFERGKRWQRFCIRPLLQFTRVREKRSRAERCIYIYIYTTVRINPLLRGRFRVVSSFSFPTTFITLSFFYCPSQDSPQFCRVEGEKERIYNTQCSPLQRISLQVSCESPSDVVNQSCRATSEAGKSFAETFKNQI